jgi:hypothetical protein
MTTGTAHTKGDFFGGPGMIPVGAWVAAVAGRGWGSMLSRGLDTLWVGNKSVEAFSLESGDPKACVGTKTGWGPRSTASNEAVRSRTGSDSASAVARADVLPKTGSGSEAR